MCFAVNIAKILRTPVLKNIKNITSNIRSEEDIFSKTKQKNISKIQLDEKNLPFHDDS